MNVPFTVDNSLFEGLPKILTEQTRIDIRVVCEQRFA